jgi:hypothetical protein
VLLLNECLLLFIPLSTQSGNFWIHPRIWRSRALDGGELSASRPGRFTTGERAHGTHWLGAGLDVVAKRKDPFFNQQFQPTFFKLIIKSCGKMVSTSPYS